MKFLIFLVIALVACRVLFSKWPWQFWIDSERSQAEAQARGLLGVDHRASREDVVAAHRRALQTAHPDRGGTSEDVHKLDRARDLLLDRIAREKR